MLVINIILAIFTSLIIYHIIYNIIYNKKIIEGLKDSDEYIPPPKDSTEYTAAEVAAQLEQLKKRESKYQIQMKELITLKKKMEENTETIADIQKGLAEMEAA